MNNAEANAKSLEQARRLDAEDPLRSFRDRFFFPVHACKDPVYLVGNSLGLEPRRTREVVLQELDAWAKLGVEGHFAKDGPVEPWFSYHELFTERGAALVGAVPGEVVAMGSLTTNLHLLMVSFYRPTTTRYRIVIEGGAFPSDRYAVRSQALFHRDRHGRDAGEVVVELAPRAGEDLLRTEDVLRFIEEEGDSVAVFLMGGVNYYTGQLFDIRAITAAARKKGIVVGWDLAHAAGNALLRLHDDDVDFAAWCTYKYLNAGPGSVGMAFVHERHARSFDLPRFWGWWGNDPKTRFSMGDAYEPQPGAAGWQISNAPILSMAALHASLEIFAEATMEALRRKSEALTAWLLALLDDLEAEKPGAIRVITPRDPAARGAQLSLRRRGDPEGFLKLLAERGVFADFRRPDVIRVAPAPLYCSFEDCWRFARILRETA
jgi:kynureninase